ncbi:non-ribosomal peptide synthetase [Longimicrobium sp.]|uniref:non-ribosomal peptide synthetase n=1 Tax=Longimicrobium sp. TaxID=2029185 RepID=UPI002C002731|nr:non-ribosomal peptide synthetase [Longimicrobium sp.]HSU17559.1 amino acid adenylation domain-containing protein [Longimicrobium sp.]
MTAPTESAGALSRSEKLELLRKIQVERISRTRTAPASFAQERLWFLARLQPESALYNLPEAQRLTGALDAAALERALGEVVRRHEVLRTTFAEEDGAPVQVIAPFAGFTLSVEDLSALADDEREAAVRRRAGEEAARPFDLAAGPLFRATLLRLADDDHVLLLCTHHIASDGWSRGVLFREIAALYAAFAGGGPPPLAEPALQFADHAAAQRERLRGEALDRPLAWWKERLAGAPALLELPADHPRPAVQSYRGAVERIALAPELAGRLRALARGEDATLFMALMAGFQALLAKYTGSGDVVVGTPIAGRSGTEVEELIGFFVNTLAVRTDLSGDPGFRALLGRVREGMLGAYAHGEVPFERLVEELRPDRSLSHSPVFQAMFVVEENDADLDGLPGIRPERVEVETGTAKFDLTLRISLAPGRFTAEAEFSTDLFERATIRRMLGHFQRLLEQAAEHPDLPLSEMEMLDAAERSFVIDELNRTEAPYPHASLDALFAEQAARTPDAVAVVFGDDAVTYGELDARSNRFARHLRRLGVGHETRVGICLERGMELVVAILGTLKAGGAYVPLDPGYPAGRLAFMLADSGVAVLVTEEKLAASLPVSDGVATVRVDGDADAIAAESAEPAGSGAGPRSLAYVIYTSGSTGTPKGVAVEHRSVVRLVRGANYVALGPDEVILQAAPVSFDASTLEIWGALLNGGRMVMVAGANPTLEELGRAIVRHGVTTMWLTAGLFQVMVEERLDDLRGVRQLLAGGDVLPVEAVRRLGERIPGCRVINGYGPTENTTFTCCYPVPDGWSGTSIPIGRPISNTRVYVLDAALRPVPVGVPGELYAAGHGVARGYLNRPELTDERFVPDPFSAEPGARMYRTGDRVRWKESAEVRECGSAPDPRENERTPALPHSRTLALEYLGRLDGQVKVRGFRIEPGEVEATLMRHPAVADCAVVARDDGPGGKRLVAYVVGGADAEELRAHLRASLPGYMVPGAFVALDALPLSPNGKVDRAALPAPDAAADADGYAAPRTPAEEVLAAAWAELLGRERVGVTENFFALGGHSLLATRVISRVRTVFGVELTVRALFEAPTVAELAARVEAARAGGTAAALPPVEPAPRDRPLPVSFQQRQLWLVDRLQPGLAVYNVPAAWRLSGALDADSLRAALDGVVRRHEALRTVLRAEGGEPVQVVLAEIAADLPVDDLSALEPAAREREVRARMRRSAEAPFDLERGPLFRAELLRLAGDEHLLLFCVHHVVSDGWSLGVLFGELAALYAGQDEATLPAVPVQYADYAAWQRALLSGERLARQVEWWRGHLAPAPALLALPTDHPRPAVQSYRGALHRFALSARLAEGLEALARREGASLYMVLLAAWQVLLARYSGQEQVVVGGPAANRPRAELEGLVGFFANAMALRTDLSGDPSFREVVARVRETTLEAYAHQEVPFETLVGELQPERSLGHNPIFQAFFALHGRGEALRLAGVRAEPVPVEIATAKFDVSLFLTPTDDGLDGSIEYATDLFDAATAERMAAHLEVLLGAVAADPARRLSALPVLTGAERETIVRQWSGAGESFPVTTALHRRFEARAAERPDAVALTCDGSSLTYGELNARANRLARRLRALGVAPESRVGLVAERSLDMIAGILAILKAGGAYVPLDPAYPEDRLAYMAGDSGIRVLLGQSALRDRVPADGIPFLAQEDVPADELPEDLDVEIDPAHLAYVIYTSGSTGRPKGVGVTHGNVLRLFDSTASGFGFSERDVWTLFHSYAFDFSVWEIWGALLYGGRLVVVPWTVSRDFAAFRELLAAERVTMLSQTPSAFRALCRADEAQPEPLEHLRAVVFGGEALNYAALRGWLDRYGPRRPRLVNMYGITETTVHVTWHTVTGQELRRETAGSGVGVAIPDLRAYVLDRAGNPSPVGVPGELFVGGAGLARGYLGRPGLTATRFVPDPFSGEAGARLYRSGDLARWKADGTLEYLGRIDQQVKIRGFRIELGEIESLLLAQPGISAAAVVVRGEGDDASLAAYLVPSGQAPAAAELRDALRRHLPEYMVPSAFVAIDKIPLTANGKLDRAALPDPDAVGEPSGDAFVAPRTPVEEVLAAVWAEVLGADRVSVDENFFELGGHSLLATLVMARIREVFAAPMPVRILFEAPTVAELAVRVDAQLRADLPALPPVAPVERTRALPLSFGQERLWFLQRLQPESTPYNHFLALRLEGALDVAAMERALGEIVRRHESLRTVFPEVDGGPVQVVLPFAGFTLPVEDVAGVDEAALSRLVSAEAARPYDLAAEPAFRARLVRLAPRSHLLILATHHIATDGWSVGILQRELSSLYAAFRDGRTPRLEALPVQYADYAAWQREQLRGAALEAQMSWWRSHLAGAPTLLELPADHPRPAAQSYRGGVHHFTLPARLVASLEALQRAEGATLYMVLLAAFQTLLARYAGCDDVVVGSPAAGRAHKEVEGLIGFFVNTMVLRTRFDGDPGFRDVLRRVREATLGAYEHQEAPFEKMVEELQPERSLGHNPLFQAFFALQNLEGEALRLPGLAIAEIPMEGAKAVFDLSLFLTRGDAGLDGALVYATDLFDAATAERMAAHLEALLEAAAADPKRRVSTIPLLSQGERETIVREWSGAGESFPVTTALHRRFEARAAERPDAVALTCEGQSLTYGELNARANRLARRLRALGVAPESRVGLVAERSLDMIAGILAILKAGGAYVPLDPAYPEDRLAYMAGDSGIRVLLGQSALRDRVPADGIPFLALEDVPADELPGDLDVEVDPAHLAYVIYTSGSTGRPKGVGVMHGNVLRLFDSTASGFGFGERDVWTLFHSYAFDFSVWEIWGALLYGGRLVVVPWTVSRDFAAFRELLAAERVTMLSQTPSAFRALCRADEAQPEPLEHLRAVVFGGEALNYAALRGWLDRYGPRRPRLVNMYGITETTVHVTWHTVTGAELRRETAGSGVGVAIPDLRAYVLDRAGNPSPVGVPGELFVGGAGLARGYLGRPGLTATRFVPDPFSGDAGARLYRSGDLARWKADGTLEYLGRIDQQVKIRGFRIELGEIESLLLAHPGISAAAVVVRGEGDDASLAAYLVPSGQTPAAAELRDALRRHLPEYMVPSAFVAIERIPLTANGKLDRAALPEPDAAGSAPADGYVAPRTPVEEVLAGVWAEVLGVERVGALDNFFELGGHSLLATQVMARIREIFGVGVPLRLLFEGPSVAELAERLEALRRAGLPVLPPVAAVERQAQMPLSFGQERLWFLQRLQPESTTYNHPTALRLRGPLDAAALERALGEIVRRHESLRTTFPERGGAPVQVIAPFAGFSLPVAEHPGADEDEVRRIVDLEAARAFDLAQGPLFRAWLVRIAPQDHLLLLSMHHIVTDGWSMGVLFRELAALYAAFGQGGESPLAEPAVQYADYAAWERAQLRGPALDAELAYWKERLSGAPALLELPTDHPRPAVQTHRGADERIALPAALVERLRALGRGEGATLYMVLLAAFQSLLARHAGSDDVVVGSPVAGRTRRELEEVIGFFVNTLVLRTDLSADPTFREALRRVRETTLGAWEHQGVPFEKLVEELHPERSLGHAPLFQVMFQLVDGGVLRGELPGVRAEVVEAGSDSTKFDLGLAFVEEADGLLGVMEYNADLFEPATIRRMLAQLHRVLEQVAGDADPRLSELELLDAGDRERLLVEWNATDRDWPLVPVHAAVAAQARRAPDAVALLHAGGSLTYAELDARAEAVARRLRALGVRPEVPVGVCTGRTPELLAAVLGIWKAGGAFVPLDPDYPADRLAWIASDAALPVIVTAGSAAAALPEHAATLVHADEIHAEAGAAPVAAEVSPSTLAYVIYTSGSTGKPKGVLVEHGSLANLLAATRDAFGVAPGDVMPALASYAFDIWLFEALLPLTSGAATRLVERERVLDVAALMGDIADATLLHAVPALMRQIAREERAAPRLGRLRRTFVGGDLVSPDLLGEMAGAFPAAATHILYGPTEGTILASWHPVAADGRVEAHPIGLPFGNVRLYVCDAHGRLQPPGVPGELLIGGLGVARGYLGRPDLTDERFIPDPFSGNPGARLYRTGDRVRWCESAEVRECGSALDPREAERTDALTHSRTAFLEYLGRLDGQVKIRGYRIEPGEVEAALRTHPGVRECAVIAREDAPGEKRLVGYVVGEGDGEALRSHLRQTLPEYMVPSPIVFLDGLPRSPNGKLDRRALPAPEQGGGTASPAPRNELESLVAEVWREVVGAAEIGVHDNFFDLGGTSLLLYRVFSRLREARADLRMVDLFRYTTVEELAGYLAAAGTGDDAGLAESRSRAEERRAARRRVRN